MTLINQVILVGRLTRKPELKSTPDGRSVLNVILAVNRQFRNESGEKEADFVQCILWRKTAENLAQYCTKGSLIGITGRIQTRSYDNSDRKRVFVTEVIAEQVKFLDNKRKEMPERSLKKEEMIRDGREISRSESDRVLAGKSNKDAW